MAEIVLDGANLIRGGEGAEQPVKGDGHWQMSGCAVHRDEDLTATDLYRHVGEVIW